MTNICEIAQLGAAVLRQQSARITQIHSPDIRQLIEDMQTTLASTQGVGLAAPQISQLKQIIIVASRPSPRYPLAPEMEPTIMVNPTFEPLSHEKEKDWEGCLSIPGIRALVPRYTTINVSYTNIEGNTVTQSLTGFIARIFQHEVDHLQGKVYLDRVENSLDIMAEAEYVKLFKATAVAWQ